MISIKTLNKKKMVRRICSLALVPKDQIDYCWTGIHAQAPQHEGNISNLFNTIYCYIYVNKLFRFR